MNVNMNGVGAMNMMQRPGKPPMPEEMQQLMQQVGGNSEVRDFMGSMRDAIRSGEFDSAEFAANAPEQMQQFAAEMGVDLQQQFAGIADKAQQFMANRGMGQGGGMGQKLLERFAQNTQAAQFDLAMDSLQFSASA